MEFIKVIQEIQQFIPPAYAYMGQVIAGILPYLTLTVALLTCFLGHKLHRFWMSFLFFCIGFLIGFVPLIFFPEGINVHYFILLGLLFGVLAVVCSQHIYRAQIFLLNAFFVYVNLPNLLSHFLPGGVSILLGLAAAVIVGVLAVRYKFLVTIITSSVTGALSAARLFLQMAQLQHWLLYLILSGILACAGLCVQYLVEKQEIQQAQNRVAGRYQKLRKDLSNRNVKAAE